MSRKKETTVRNFFLFYLIIAIFLLLRLLVFTSIIVSGSSMEPNLKDGDRGFVLRHSKIQRFDIITFAESEGENYIKRVIGLPGETITFKNDILYVNDKAVAEPFLTEAKAAVTDDFPLTFDFTLESVTGEMVVPNDQYFVMGDNRRISKDSRQIGFVKKDQIRGEITWLYEPVKRIGKVD